MKDTLIELIWLIGGTEKIVRMTKNYFPQCCTICENEIINFYNNYSRKKTWIERKNLLNEIIMSTKCQCFNNIKKQAENTQNDNNIYDRLSFVYKYLESEFKGELY